jgi:nitrogenase molybdenum-cofactor synthesis protein NifE
MKNELVKKRVFLKDLQEDSVFEKTANAQFPGAPCAFRVVAGTLPLIENSYALLIGPEICLYNAKLTMSQRSLTNEPLPNNLLFLLISNDDIVFGISDKIRNAIKDISKRYHPEVLFIVTTCLQEIIGEDFDSLIEETQEKTDVPLLGIHTENFTCESARPGMENVSLALLELMKEQTIKKNSVNILGLRMADPNDTELVKLLKSEGIIIKNIIPSRCLPSEIAEAPGAEYNLVMEEYSLPLAIEMEKKFGTKYIYIEKPYTPDEIEKMYQKIAKLLNIDIKQTIETKKAILENEIEVLSHQLRGKSCIVGMLQGVQMGRYFNLVELLLKLGMEVKGLILTEMLKVDWDDIKKLKKKGINLPIINAGNAMQNESFIKELNPDYYIGFNDIEILARLGIEPRSLIETFKKTGFEVLEETLRLLSKQPSGFEIINYKEDYIKRWENQ